ncbi:helix-turn-helix transcriptional regulator [Haloechinothrix sp. LS1_15]|uniref:helix-turn-helix domain-containing protein n=1 Tax=Haloechinothrix sp. LS1_15 TaxID=2652248 RepID=UPI002947024B|nr:helix-turn-helix transcriptional regulator [Haloechinothrix sp. LS1_15]MDV6013842.1 helix-turn-helix domain-containing protein [Haloechinothrix sp. LS1_15]
MPSKSGPTLRAQWLGQHLHQLRVEAGLKLRDVGEYLQRDGSTIGRFESGEYPIRRPDLLALIDLYRVSGKRKREALLELHRESWQRGWWDDYAGDVDEKFVDFMWLEQRATGMQAFEQSLVTGLLQTEDYARAVISGAEPHATAEQVERWVGLRMTRQQLLDRDQPPGIRAVLDEAVLTRRIGDAAVRAGQLRHLLALAERPGIEVRVLPFTAGAHPGVPGSFKIFEMAEPYPEVGYVETIAGALYVEPPNTERFRAAYDGLVQAALSPQQSAERIAAEVDDVE